MLDEETEYKLLKMLQDAPQSSQRDIARAMGISLGKANYCLRALAEKGWIKVRNFYHNPNKRGYVYLLTPNGLERKARVTLSFLRRKQGEYESLKLEIARLQDETRFDPGEAGHASEAKLP